MTDRSSEDSPVAPRRTLGAPTAPPGGSGSAKGSGASAERESGSAEAGNGRGGAPAEAKRSGAERFAEAIAAARGGKDGGTQATRTGTKPGTKPGDASATRTGGTEKVTGTVPLTGPRKVRKAHLRVTHVDPWSVMKTSFLLSIAVGIVTVVAVMVIWSVLGVAGVWESIDKTVSDVVGDESSEPFRIEDYVGMSRVMGFTMIVAVVDVVLITVIATLGAFLYNLAAVLLGGIELTLAEDERPAGSGR